MNLWSTFLCFHLTVVLSCRFATFQLKCQEAGAQVRWTKICNTAWFLHTCNKPEWLMMVDVVMLSSPTLDRLYKYVLDTPVHTWIDCSCAPHAPSQSSTKKTLLNLPTFLFGQNEQQNRRCGHDVHEILIHNLHPSSYGTSHHDHL